MIPFSKPSIGQEEIKAVTEVLNSGWLAAGEKTKQFEEEFARYVGVKYAIFTNSCTAALRMAYKYYLEKGQGSLTYPLNTYSATYAVGAELGMLLVARDSDMDDLCRVNVHYGGVLDTTPCDVEDSAHRIEADDPLVGKIRCYSFYVTKNMTTGSGGMFVTNDDEIYKRARLYWQDGINKSTYDRQHGGWNYEVKTMAGGNDGNDIAAAIGLVQLKKLPSFTKERNQIRDLYNKAFVQDWQGNHLYPYFVKSISQVESLINYLKTMGIQASYHYPNSNWLGVSLPIYPELKPSEQTKIIEEVLLWQSEQY